MTAQPTALIRILLGLLSLLLLQGTTATPPNPQDSHHPLYVTLEVNDDGIQLTGRMQGEPPISGPRADKTGTERFRRMYQILEHRLPDPDALQRINRELSHMLVSPIEGMIDRCSELVITLQGEILETPFDLLDYRGKPLFLQKPVSYRIGWTSRTPVVPSKWGSAFVVSDASADPQRGCQSIASMLHRVVYRDVHEVSAASLRREPRSDIVLLSVHGVVGGKRNEDHLTLGGETVLPADFASLRPRLVYFDSCRLGVSRAFLSRFRVFGTRYFIAPILSNEAGESSTHTMRLFFEQMRDGETPEAAMFFTRKNLWERYARDHVVTRLWRASPFRVYRLN